MTRDDDLTARQRAAVDFIASHQRDHGYPPTVREIGKAVGQSSASTTHDMLNRLERRGVIKREVTQAPRSREAALRCEAAQKLLDHADAGDIDRAEAEHAAAGLLREAITWLGGPAC